MPTAPAARHGAARLSGSSAVRGGLNAVIKTGLMLSANLPRLHGYPLDLLEAAGGDSNAPEGETPKEPSFWLYVSVAFVLVMLGGVFAGLTLGLMGQDEIYLQVLQQSGDESEKKHAAKVLRLLKRGKHWVLVTLLLSNVITNETLPIVLDRSLGGGWPAVLSSTVLIVIFGEIIPQSVCVRYGLSIGAALSPFVLGLMYIMYPVAYPTALLLDYILGEDHGTVYKKAGLKTLVTLHRTLGPSPSERLNQDEVTIISAVLDLKDKPVGTIATPIQDVFTMSADTVLDEHTMNDILSAGYSRIPIHTPGEPENFIGMLLVKILITYDPEDAKKVRDFPLATLPETREETSCLDIVNFFQEGKSHMVLVSEYPGEDHGAMGVVTLEDVIEELIGEEIVDESDVYIDVHKAIRRINPSPLARSKLTTHYMNRNADQDAVINAAAAAVAPNEETDVIVTNDETNARPNVRRASERSISAMSGSLPKDAVAHLTLGPANLAGRPRETKSKTVKVKNAESALAAANKRLSDENHIKSSYGATDVSVVPEHEITHGVDGAEASDDSKSERKRKVTGNMGGKRVARSGSLIERVETAGGIRKTVIETTSSEEEDEADGSDGDRKSGGERSPLLSKKKS